MRPEIIELRKKRENYHMWLVQRGENDDNIQNALKSNENTKTANTELCVYLHICEYIRGGTCVTRHICF